MVDIAQRLRHQVRDLHGDDFASPYEGFVSPLDAANEIERLEADNERLRAALRVIAEDDIYLRNCATWHDTGKMKTGVQAFARAALGK